MKKELLSKIIRILIVPPILALLVFTYLFIFVPGIFMHVSDYIMAVSFISIFPSLAYVLQIPLKKWFPGRDGQRTLAMILSVAGYICGLATSLILQQSPHLIFIYLTYFLIDHILLFLQTLSKSILLFLDKKLDLLILLLEFSC